MRLVGSGKVKDIYDNGDETLCFHFSDRVSAYDVQFQELIPRKGEVLCRFAEFWFDRLDVANHYVRTDSPTTMIVRRLKMIPIECIARGYLYGSLYDRHARGADVPCMIDGTLAERLSEPVFDPTTKAAHDLPVTREQVVSSGMLSAAQYDELSEMTLRIYAAAADAADAAGFIMADIKLEFGIDAGRLILADSIGPDEFRLWPKHAYEPGRVQEAYDKQILRDWLKSCGYKEQFEQDRAAGREPSPPAIPDEIISKMSCRYVSVFEKITGKRFRL